MNSSRLARLATVAILLNSVTAFAQTNPRVVIVEITSLAVSIKNLSPPTGTIEVTLFNSAETFMKEPYRQQSGKSNEKGEFITEFTDLTSGEYAVVVVHDANDNGKLDTGFLGFGGESYRFSNNASSWFGRPDFEDAVIVTAPEGNLVEIDFE
jgi:uncharacterized protein (DUF2141 family)